MSTWGHKITYQDPGGERVQDPNRDEFGGTAVGEDGSYPDSNPDPADISLRRLSVDLSSQRGDELALVEFLR